MAHEAALPPAIHFPLNEPKPNPNQTRTQPLSNPSAPRRTPHSLPNLTFLPLKTAQFLQKNAPFLQKTVRNTRKTAQNALISTQKRTLKCP